MTLQEIMNTDCYLQFDSNEQLIEFAEVNGINFELAQSNALVIRFYSGKNILPDSLREGKMNYTSYHISQLTQPTSWWDSVHTMD